jgi:hypothetical protein
VKATDPVGRRPVTFAVKVTLEPGLDGLAELESVTLLVALLTVCDIGALLEAAFDPLPPYAATML